MEKESREEMRQRLDEAVLGFRLGRTAAGEVAGWLRDSAANNGGSGGRDRPSAGGEPEGDLPTREVRGGIEYPVGNSATGGGGTGLRVGLRVDAAAGNSERDGGNASQSPRSGTRGDSLNGG